MNNREKGFSLIELLIVVAIILVITAIAIPSITAALASGRESAAVSTMKAVVTANTAYRTTWPNVGYAQLAKHLGEGGASDCPNNSPDPAGQGACLLAKATADQLDAGSASSGYTYTYTQNGATGYTLTAHPTTPGDARKSFIADASGTISYAWGQVPPVSVTAGTILGQ